MIKCLRFALIGLLASTLLAGCATERHVSPTLNASPRAGLELKPPILGAVSMVGLHKSRKTQHQNSRLI